MKRTKGIEYSYEGIMQQYKKNMLASTEDFKIRKRLRDEEIEKR